MQKKNKDVFDWNLSNITNMNNMFDDSKFNSNISSWSWSTEDIEDDRKMGEFFIGSEHVYYIIRFELVVASKTKNGRNINIVAQLSKKNPNNFDIMIIRNGNCNLLSTLRGWPNGAKKTFIKKINSIDPENIILWQSNLIPENTIECIKEAFAHSLEKPKDSHI